MDNMIQLKINGHTIPQPTESHLLNALYAMSDQQLDAATVVYGNRPETPVREWIAEDVGEEIFSRLRDQKRAASMNNSSTQSGRGRCRYGGA